jgi:hypothetical protein
MGVLLIVDEQVVSVIFTNRERGGMGCCSGKAGLTDKEREDQQYHNMNAKKGKELQEKDNRVLKILLLGPGESGKSTIFKQMHLLYGTDGFNDAVRHNFKQVIRKNVVEWMQGLIKAAERFKLPFESKVRFLAILRFLNVSCF